MYKFNKRGLKTRKKIGKGWQKKTIKLMKEGRKDV